MLFPKKVAYRRWQRMRFNPRKTTPATRGAHITFGDIGLQSMERKRIRSNQIESARKVIARTTGKTGKMWIRVFPDRPFTQKAAEVPMGKGKGAPAGYEVEVRPGRILFELTGVPEATARVALTKAGKKLPVRTKVVLKV